METTIKPEIFRQIRIAIKERFPSVEPSDAEVATAALLSSIISFNKKRGGNLGPSDIPALLSREQLDLVARVVQFHLETGTTDWMKIMLPADEVKKGYDGIEAFYKMNKDVYETVP